MSLYILSEKASSYFVETRAKQEIAVIKSLNQKRIPTVVFTDIEDVPEIFNDPKAVLLILYGINDNNCRYVELCNENNIPVITLHDKSNSQYKYIYSSVADNDDITASMIYRYFKSNGKERIAFFGFYANSESDLSKVNSFYDVNFDFDYKDVFHIKSGFDECIEDFMQHRYEYDGIYFPNDFLAIAFINYFKEVEPSYLDDRFLLGCMDTTMSRLCHVSLSSVTYTIEAVKAAVLQIYRSLTNNKNDFKCMSIGLNNIITPRDSTQKKILANSESFSILNKRNMKMKFERVAHYNHKNDPALKDIFNLENLFLNAKSMDLLIIYMFIKGYSNSTITHKLFLAPQSLNTHKNNYFKKLGCDDKNEFIKVVSKYISLEHLEDYIQYVSNEINDFSNF